MSKPDYKAIEDSLSCIYTDMMLLKEDIWQPDEHSVQDTIEQIEFVASELDLTIIDNREKDESIRSKSTD